MVRRRYIKELYNFEPKYTFSQLKQNLPQGFESQIHNSRLYKAVETLTGRAYPTEESKYEKRWLDFYLPLKRKGYFILVPMAITLYDKSFFLSLLNSQIEVRGGNENNFFYAGLIEQTLKFSLKIKKDPDIVTKSIPYDIRTGQVLGKYILENPLSCELKEEMLKLYGDHIKKGETLHSVSLNDYLNTAALCYKASFGDKTKGLTAEQMYRKWADGRDYGMLEIKNKKSKEIFSRWFNNKSHCGGHPFEIVFSWHDHGIHLIPPYPDNPYFTLRVTDYMYVTPFLEMVKSLIRNRIPFKAHELKKVLDYLSGESYFTVNAYDIHNIFYTHDSRKLFKHIKWDDPKMLKWK